MERLNLSRRSFVKVAAATAAVSSMSLGLGAGLAQAEPADVSESGVKRVRSCCRGCGKMECGVWVIVKDGRAVAVEGDESAFQSMGNCCAKSQASIQAAYHPDRLYYPMKRTNPKGEDDAGWVRISWDEAIKALKEKTLELSAQYGPESLFAMSGTSRLWGMIAYGAFSQLTGSPNIAIPWQVCKGPRHFGTALQSVFQYSWQETVARPNVLTYWGTGPELSNYDDSCRTVVDASEKASQYICVDPRLTNLGKEADQWLALRPGTDAAMVLSWTNVIIENNLYDDLFVKKWTNAPYLVMEGEATLGGYGYKTMAGTFDVRSRLLTEADLIEGGNPMHYMVWDAMGDKLTYCDAETCTWEGEVWAPPTEGKEAVQEHLVPGVSQGFVIDPTPFSTEIDPALTGTYEVTLKDGTTMKCRPVWEHFVERCAEYAPEKAEAITGVPADKIRKAALTYGTRLNPETGYGNGGILYQLAIEHSCNAIQCVRAFDTLIGITGNWDVPGGSRGCTQGSFILGCGIGWQAPGQPASLTAEMYDKALGCIDFPVLKWWQHWSDDSTLFKALETGNPYPLKLGWCSTSDFMCMSNATQKYNALKDLDFFVVQDLWKTPTAGLADILFPAQHWIETNAPRQSQGGGGAEGATVRAVEPPADTLHDQEIIVAVFKEFGVPWSAHEDDPWPTYEGHLDEVLESSGVTWAQYSDDFQKNGWRDCKVVNPPMWGTYRRYETGMIAMKCIGDRGLGMNPLKELSTPGFGTPTRKMEIWSTVIESFDPDRPEDILPSYHEPPLSPIANPAMNEKYPLTAISGRRIPVYFHSEHRQLPWCRELWPAPRCEINPDDAAEMGIKQGDWVWIENDQGKIRQTADLYYGIQKGVVHVEHQWWFPELDQADKGFDLSCANCLVTTGPEYQDPICGSSYLRAYPVKVYKATKENSPFGNPVPCDHKGNEIIYSADDPRLKEWLPVYDVREA